MTITLRDRDKRINQLESRIKQLETLITQSSEKDRQLPSSPAVLPVNLPQIPSLQQTPSFTPKDSFPPSLSTASKQSRPVDYTLIERNEGKSQYYLGMNTNTIDSI